MRHFAYNGNHAEVTLYGVTFPQGAPVTVRDDFLIQKLVGNSHFDEVKPKQTRKPRNVSDVYQDTGTDSQAGAEQASGDRPETGAEGE